MYRTSKKRLEQLAQMRRAKEIARLASPSSGNKQEEPELPFLRRRITIEDFDFGRRIHVLEMYRTDRIDCYRVVSDRQEWKQRIGWSRLLAALRKAMPRISIPT